METVRVIQRIFYVLALMLLVQLAPCFAYAEMQYTEAIVNADDVAMRTEAASGSPILTRLPSGTKLELLETNRNAEWHKVKYKTRTGYVNRIYLNLVGTKLTDTYVGTVVNCLENINVRSAPDKKSELLGSAALGESFTVTSIDIQNGYYGIDFNGVTGYVSTDYMSVSEQAEENQLSDIRITGGNLLSAFSPDVYGYVVRVESDTVRIETEAESGTKVYVGKSHKGSLDVEMPETGVKTVRIRVNGQTRYSLYLIRNVLTVSTYNIKRGNGHTVEMGEQIASEQPDIMGLQEVYRCPKTEENEASNNLLALRTKHMSETAFATTVTYPSTGEYGIGLLSAYKLKNVTVRNLTAVDIEPRCVIRATIEIDGKEVSVYNTHLSYESVTTRTQQFNELLAFIEEDSCPYKILFGDFNIKEHSEYKGLEEIMTEVNTENTSYYGYDGEAYEFTKRIDNIFVSKNIHVWNSRLNGEKISDHRMLIAYITLE